MIDQCLRAHLQESRLEVAVSVTSQLCRQAQEQHGLSGASAIALGRLLTSVSLLGLTGRAKGTSSLQLVSRGKLKRLFADVNEEGHLRGFLSDPSCPTPRAKSRYGRPEIGSALLPGELVFLVKYDDSGHRSSSVQMQSGEVDEDVEHLLFQSEQRRAALRTELSLNEDGSIHRAAGVYVHALPDGDGAALERMRAALAEGALADRLGRNPDAEGILAALAPGAVQLEAPVPLQLRCRCSLQRVIRSLQLLELSDLMDIVKNKETLKVGCEFCGTQYEVPPEEPERLLQELIRAQA